MQLNESIFEILAMFTIQSKQLINQNSANISKVHSRKTSEERKSSCENVIPRKSSSSFLPQKQVASNGSTTNQRLFESSQKKTQSTNVSPLKPSNYRLNKKHSMQINDDSLIKSLAQGSVTSRMTVTKQEISAFGNPSPYGKNSPFSQRSERKSLTANTASKKDKENVTLLHQSNLSKINQTDRKSTSSQISLENNYYDPSVKIIDYNQPKHTLENVILKKSNEKIAKPLSKQTQNQPSTNKTEKISGQKESSSFFNNEALQSMYKKVHKYIARPKTSHLDLNESAKFSSAAPTNVSKQMHEDQATKQDFKNLRNFDGEKTIKPFNKDLSQENNTNILRLKPNFSRENSPMQQRSQQKAPDKYNLLDISNRRESEPYKIYEFIEPNVKFMLNDSIIKQEKNIIPSMKNVNNYSSRANLISIDESDDSALKLKYNRNDKEPRLSYMNNKENTSRKSCNVSIEEEFRYSVKQKAPVSYVSETNSIPRSSINLHQGDYSIQNNNNIIGHSRNVTPSKSIIFKIIA